MEVSGQFHAKTALPPRQAPSTATEYETLWGPEPVWTFWRREKYFAPAVTRTPDRRLVPSRHTEGAEGVLTICYKESFVLFKANRHRHVGTAI
jgi:hypothetical protein